MEAGDCWQLSCIPADFTTPDWAKGATIYQIFPDRFHKAGRCDLTGKLEPYTVHQDWYEEVSWRPTPEGVVLNNDFFGGNFRGITAKMDYIASLGTTILYLNPISKSFSSHRYDTGDYKTPDPMPGTEADFAAMCKAAHARGIRVILDGVYSHTGSNSLYFDKERAFGGKGAYCTQNSPYSGWYTFYQWPDNYNSWWGFDTLPTVNKMDKSFIEYIITGPDSVLEHWLRLGADGFRLDVVDELPNEFVLLLKKRLRELKPDALLIGEVWEDASNKIAYGERREYFQGDELDSVMNYPLKDAIINFLLSGNTSRLREVIAMLIDHYPKSTLDCLMNHLGTHDTARILTVLGGKSCHSKDEMAATSLNEQEKAAAKELLKMGAVVQFTLPGVPCIYYGDEIGMEGYSDPFCRGCYDWENGDRQLRSFYEQLGRIRGQLKDVFRDGTYREIYATQTFLVYERKSTAGSVYVYVNRGSCQYKLSFEGTFREYLSGKTYRDGLVIKKGEYGIISRI